MHRAISTTRPILISLILAATAMTGLTGCMSDAGIAHHRPGTLGPVNATSGLKTPRIMFYNGNTGQYLLSIDGTCALEWGKVRTFKCTTTPSSRSEPLKLVPSDLHYFSAANDQ